MNKMAISKIKVGTTEHELIPAAHASSAITYGIGTGSNYGHVKLSDSTSSTSAASSGIAATPAAVKLAYDKVISRGEQLIVNGNGLMGNNTNFSNFTYDGSVANNSPGSFTKAANTRYTLDTDEFFPVNPANSYILNLDVISKNGLATMYTYLSFYDADKNSIGAQNHMFKSGSTTTLAKDLKAGDTVAYLTDVSGWSTSTKYGIYLSIWNYQNSYGYVYPKETYTRNRVSLTQSSSYLTNLNTTNKTVTLASAYSGATIPAGTYVSQGMDGSTYKYCAMTNVTVPKTWTTYKGTMSGLDTSGTNISSKFPPGTAYAKFGFLWNYNAAADQIWVTNISVTENSGYITGGASSIVNSNLTASRALVSDSSGKVAVSAVTNTELGYLDGVTSAIQTQLNGKMSTSNPTGTGSFSLNRKANTTIGTGSFASGTNTTASGSYSHAEGSTTTASGSCSHAEGYFSTASGDYGSHAEGESTTASGSSSHAEGYGSTASRAFSHAEGYYTTADGLTSHAEGYETTANSKSQHVQGEYNVLDVINQNERSTYAHIVGNGTSTSKRSNAHTLDWSGNAWFAGDVYVGSTSGTNKDAGSKKLATVDDIAAAIGSAIAASY